MPRPVLVLAGPTASGKTALALRLASVRPVEIISADSRQVYRMLDIGTAKPTAEELARCPHHLISTLDPLQTYTAAQYAHDVRELFETIPETSLPVMVGGAGLYIQAALDGLSVPPGTPDNDVRKALEFDLLMLGKDAVYERLMELDPRAAERYADRNPRRVLRALEYIESTGKLFSDTWHIERAAANATPTYVALRMDRDLLRHRIRQRCVDMWDQGLLDETRRILKHGVEPTAQALQTVGYMEALSVLRGGSSHVDALENMVAATNRYAKRQLTWFRRDTRYQWIDADDPTYAFDHLMKIVDRIFPQS